MQKSKLRRQSLQFISQHVETAQGHQATHFSRQADQEVMAEQELGEVTEREQAGRERREAIKGEIQVNQEGKTGDWRRERGQQAREGFTLGIVKAVTLESKNQWVEIRKGFQSYSSEHYIFKSATFIAFYM